MKIMSEPETGAEARLTVFDRVDMAYDGLELDELLLEYALGQSAGRIGLTFRIEGSIEELGQAVAPLATAEGVVYPGVVRAAFDRFHGGMEKAAAAKFGPERPRTYREAFLIDVGIRDPKYRQRYRKLDDRYWEKQFMRDYKEQSFVQLEPGESEQHYPGRYIANALSGLQWSIFSYIAG